MQGYVNSFADVDPLAQDSLSCESSRCRACVDSWGTTGNSNFLWDAIRVPIPEDGLVDSEDRLPIPAASSDEGEKRHQQQQKQHDVQGKSNIELSTAREGATPSRRRLRGRTKELPKRIAEAMARMHALEDAKSVRGNHLESALVSRPEVVATSQARSNVSQGFGACSGVDSDIGCKRAAMKRLSGRFWRDQFTEKGLLGGLTTGKGRKGVPPPFGWTPAKCLIITMFREPVSRLASAMFYCRQ
jgi:hypothetical protein